MDAPTKEWARATYEYLDGKLFLKSGHNPKPVGYCREKDGQCLVPTYYQGKRSNILLHRLIYLYHHGILPTYVRHIDGDRMNNRIENLEASEKPRVRRYQKKKEEGEYLVRIMYEGRELLYHSFSSKTEMDEALQIDIYKKVM